MQFNLENYDFTFHGDLLGISNLYSIDQTLANETLDVFYNLVFSRFKEMANNNEAKIFIFSDSIFITGSKIEKTLNILGGLYYTLFSKNIFLRGALVRGKLKFDPRIELDNLIKQLPSTDVLYRAISLEKNVKGMRLLIEKEIAKEILPKEWLTEDKYKMNVGLSGYDKYDFRRKIILAREWNAYEYLWPLALKFSDALLGGIPEFAKRILRNPREIIDEIMIQIPEDTRIHLEETKNLFDRASFRYKATNEELSLGIGNG